MLARATENDSSASAGRAIDNGWKYRRAQRRMRDIEEARDISC